MIYRAISYRKVLNDHHTHSLQDQSIRRWDEFPQWYNENGGACLGFALNKYCWISLRELPPFYDYRYRVVYSRDEITKTASEIQHPVVREVLKLYENRNGNNGFEIHYDGDIPARAGLGSSSSFVVGFLKAVYTHYLQSADIPAPSIAQDAIIFEQDVLKETVGCQDQIWAAYGGLNRIDFSSNFKVTALDLTGEKTQELLDHLMLFFTGFQRTASDIESEKLVNYNQKKTQLKLIQEHVNMAEHVLKNEKHPMGGIGCLLNETWKMKKELAKNIVSNSTLDDIYDTAMKAGALGGKLLGAGGGGFFLFCCEPYHQSQVRKALSKLIEVQVGIDWEGSKIIYAK